MSEEQSTVERLMNAFKTLGRTSQEMPQLAEEHEEVRRLFLEQLERIKALGSLEKLSLQDQLQLMELSAKSQDEFIRRTRSYQAALRALNEQLQKGIDDVEQRAKD